MPIIYNLREQSAPSSSSSGLTSSTSTYGTRNSRDPRIHEPHDDIILSDLVRGTGEASRLRRRGALLHRGDRVVDRSDRSSVDHHQSTSSPGMSHYPLNVNQRHIQPQLPNTPGDGVLLPSQDGQGTLTTRPLRWSIFAPYEDESSTATTASTSTSMSTLPSQSQPHQIQHSRFIIGPQVQYPQRQPQQPQPQSQQAPLFLPFPVTPPLDLDATRGVGAAEADFNEYTYVLRCGGNEPDDDGFEPVAAPPSSLPFVPSILPLSPSRPQQQASAPSSSRTQKRSTNGCGTIIHYKAAPLSKIRTWTARTEATDQVVHLDSCYFDSPIVGKIVPSTCGCVREGVGCAVCGNPLGTLYIPCKTAIDLSSRSPRSSSSSSSPPKLHIYSFFPSAVSSSPSYSFPSPSSPSSPSLSPTSPTSPTTSSSFTSTRRSSRPFLSRSRSRSRSPSSSRSRSRSPSPTRPSPAFLASSITSPPSQVVVPATPGHTHTFSPYSTYPSYPHRPHTTYATFNGRLVGVQSHSAPPFSGPARTDSFPMALHTPLPHVHPYVHPLPYPHPQQLHTQPSYLQAHFFPRPHSSDDGLGHERNRGAGESEGRPIPSRRMEQLPPPIPIARTYSTLGGGGTTTTTGFFFGRTTTASPIPLSDDDDDDDDDELVDEPANDLHGAGGRDLADDEKEDGEVSRDQMSQP
ncbi:hypothetical protein JOM56_009184 [Amanita muscaria]